MSALMSDGNHYYPFICFLLRQANSHSEHGSLSRTSSNEYGSTSNLSDATKQVNTVCCWRQQTAASPHLMRRSRAWLSITRVHCTELFVNCLSDMTWVASSCSHQGNSVRIREIKRSWYSHKAIFSDTEGILNLWIWDVLNFLNCRFMLGPMLQRCNCETYLKHCDRWNQTVIGENHLLKSFLPCSASTFSFNSAIPETSGLFLRRSFKHVFDHWSLFEKCKLAKFINLRFTLASSSAWRRLTSYTGSQQWWKPASFKPLQTYMQNRHLVCDVKV